MASQDLDRKLEAVERLLVDLERRVAAIELRRGQALQKSGNGDEKPEPPNEK